MIQHPTITAALAERAPRRLHGRGRDRPAGPRSRPPATGGNGRTARAARRFQHAATPATRPRREGLARLRPARAR